MQYRFGDGGQVASMSIRRGVPDIPKLARYKLIDRHAILNQTLIAKEGILIIADDVSLEVGERANDRPTGPRLLKPRFRDVACKIEHVSVLHILDSKVAGRVERIRLTKEPCTQGKRGPVTVRASDVRKARFTALCRPATSWIVGEHSAGNIHRSLKDSRCGDVPYSHFVGHAVLIKVVCGYQVSLTVFLPDSEPLDCLHSVVMIESINGEYAHGIDNAFLMKGFDDKIGIDALNQRRIGGAVRPDGYLTEVHALGVEPHLNDTVRTFGLRHCLIADRDQV